MTRESAAADARDEMRAEYEARFEDEQFEEQRGCDWCGQEATPSDPLLPAIISPPVDGFSCEVALLHRSCLSEAAVECVR